MRVDESASSSRSTKQCDADEWESEDDYGTVPFGKLFSYADNTDVVLMSLGTVGAILNGLCMPLMTVIFGELVDAFGVNQNNPNLLQPVSEVTLQFVYLAMGASCVAFLQVSCWMVTGERQASRIRGLYLKTILRQDVGFFDREADTGEVVARMSSHILLIQDAVGDKVAKFVQLITTFMAGFFIALIKGWLLTLVMLASIPPLVIAGGIMAVLISRIAARGHNAYAKAAIVVEQTVSSITTVASFTRENEAISKYNKFLVDAYKSGVEEGLAAGLGLGMVMLIVFCSYALAIWFGSKMILGQGYTGGQVLTIIMAFLTGSMSLGQAPPCMSTFGAAQAVAFKMFETIGRRPVIDAYDSQGKTLHEIRGDIELRDVYFSYPSRPEEQVFDGLSMCIPSGTTAALVGQSGSGKSTVISLVERFYDPHSGQVLIDGINLKEYQLKWIRQRIGLVSQHPILFSCSIKDNIAYGKEGATDEEIMLAAELADATSFIDKLPRGLNTVVGEQGAHLAGGQKQRVAIARVILKNPRILLLDEATSALDAECERVVQETLERIMVCRTTLIVAHRLSTVKTADMIAVIHNGKIVEKGSHEELMKELQGAYSKLVQLQEVSKEQEEDTNIGDINYTEKQAANQKKKMVRTLSRGSVGNSSGRHSFSASFGVPTSLNAQVVLEEAQTLPSEPQKKHVSIGRLAALNKPEIPVILIGAVAATANGVILPLFGVLISSVINTFYKAPDELREESECWAGMFLVLGLASLAAYPVRTYFFSVAGCRLIQRIRSMCFEKIVYMEVGWFDDPEHSSAAIGARLSADAAVVRALVGDALAQLVQNMATSIAGLVIAFTACWQLAVVVLTLIPFIVINGYIQGRFVKGFSSDAKMMYEEANQVATDAVGSIRTIASFCAEQKVTQLFTHKCEGPAKAGKKQGLISGIGYGAASLLLFCFYAISFYAGAILVVQGDTTFSDVFRVFFALTMAAIGISQSSSMAPGSVKAKTVTTSIFAMLDGKSKIDARDESGMRLEQVRGDIELRHISFKYANRPDVRILRDLSLTINAGKTVALVGESGSGKSTVISLLQRFYDPDSGHITLDGIDTRKLKVRWLRQQMGLVSQEPTLFNDTIRANIAYGKNEDNATGGEILVASELANPHKFISALMEGYDTIVGERGIQMSGGQKQRIAIARAMMRSPKIMLLDEATSALDAEAERVVQEAIERVMVDRTTVMVAHRLCTISKAHVIAVVKNGVIVEKGRHEELMKVKDGVYASMVALQTSS